ncbi:MAG: 2OG-Fe(II) oxygenase [Actinoallomurus sp.]
MTSTKTRATTLPDPWRDRVDGADWAAVTAEIDEYGGALLPQLLTPEETVEFRGLYDQDELFRSTVNIGRHRFGEGQYKYFAAPYPEPIERLKQFLLLEQRPRAQSRGTATLLPYGHGYLFTTRDRPVRSAAPVRHGVSAIRSGQRHTLALVFHDAA